MRNVVCEECGLAMHPTGKFTSGNSIYEIWQCDDCMRKKTVCSGVKEQSF